MKNRKHRSQEHQQVQKYGKIRDNYECAFCGRTEDELDEDERMEGHHVVEYHEGGPAALENIITLCSTCHKAYHAGEIDANILTF